VLSLSFAMSDVKLHVNIATAGFGIFSACLLSSCYMFRAANLAQPKIGDLKVPK